MHKIRRARSLNTSADDWPELYGDSVARLYGEFPDPQKNVQTIGAYQIKVTAADTFDRTMAGICYEDFHALWSSGLTIVANERSFLHLPSRFDKSEMGIYMASQPH